MVAKQTSILVTIYITNVRLFLRKELIMRIFAVSLISAIIVATSAMAFDLPSVPSLDSGETKLKACMLQEAQQALEKGTLTKDNIDSQAAKIATSCATKAAIKQDSSTVQLAVTVIKGLLK